jgi:hypothetical protein
VELYLSLIGRKTKTPRGWESKNCSCSGGAALGPRGVFFFDAESGRRLRINRHVERGPPSNRPGAGAGCGVAVVLNLVWSY